MMILQTVQSYYIDITGERTNLLYKIMYKISQFYRIKNRHSNPISSFGNFFTLFDDLMEQHYPKEVIQAISIQTLRFISERIRKKTKSMIYGKDQFVCNICGRSNQIACLTETSRATNFNDIRKAEVKLVGEMNKRQEKIQQIAYTKCNYSVYHLFKIFWLLIKDIQHDIKAYLLCKLHPIIFLKKSWVTIAIYNKILMKNLSTQLIFTFLIAALSASNIYTIEKYFNERQANLTSLVLPKINNQSTLEVELEQYTTMHQQRQFKDFKPNPEYSAQILLKKKGQWNQSIYFNGLQLNNLLLEVMVAHKGDHHVHDKESISIFLINTLTNEILIADKVKHMKLFKVEIQTELYELRIMFDWSLDKIQANSNEQISKHVSINIDLDPVFTVDDEGQPKKDQKQALKKLVKIKDETDRIFMGSLEIWQLINQQHSEFFKNQQEVYLRAYFQLFAVFAIYLIEYIVLRKALKIKSII